MLRDKRTIRSMVLFPVLLFPVLYIGFGLFMTSHIEKIREQRSNVAWIGNIENKELVLSYAQLTFGVPDPLLNK